MPRRSRKLKEVEGRQRVWLVAGAIVLACAPAYAGEIAGRTLYSRTPSAGGCAAYGAGFVPVVGSDSCVHVGGHVRVETGVSTSKWRLAPGAWGSGAARAITNAAPAGGGDPPFGSPAFTGSVSAPPRGDFGTALGPPLPSLQHVRGAPPHR